MEKEAYLNQSFFWESQKQNIKPKVIAYEPIFDQKAYKDLLSLKGLPEPEYEKRKQDLNAYTRRQLETHLGERFHVVLSKSIYNIYEGMLYAQNMYEPFMQVIARGRDYRRLHGDPFDFIREDAEVKGFARIQQVLCHLDTAVGTMMLSISPPGHKGSIYKHNFYDIFTLLQDEKGRYIEARRYSSALGNREYAIKVGELDPFYVSPKPVPTDADFLENPSILFKGEPFTTPDAIHEYLHRNHDFMREEQFSFILTHCGPFIDSYIQALCDNPFNSYKQLLIFNAILNKADQVADWLKQENGKGSYPMVEQKSYPSLALEINDLGMQEVRQAGTGCGSSGGFSLNFIFQSPLEQLLNRLLSFSVAEFGTTLEDMYGSREFTCPKCHRVNIRPENKLLNACQHCGSKDIVC